MVFFWLGALSEHDSSSSSGSSCAFDLGGGVAGKDSSTSESVLCSTGAAAFFLSIGLTLGDDAWT